jgi:hypothetical protein
VSCRALHQPALLSLSNFPCIDRFRLAAGARHPFELCMPAEIRTNAGKIFFIEQEVKEYGKNAAVQAKYHALWRDLLIGNFRMSILMFNCIKKLLEVCLHFVAAV